MATRDAVRRLKEMLAKSMNISSQSPEMLFAMASFSKFYSRFYNSCISVTDPEILDTHRLVKVPKLIYLILKSLGFCTFRAGNQDVPLMGPGGHPVCEGERRSFLGLHLRDRGSKFLSDAASSVANLGRRAHQATAVASTTVTRGVSGAGNRALGYHSTMIAAIKNSSEIRKELDDAYQEDLKILEVRGISPIQAEDPVNNPKFVIYNAVRKEILNKIPHDVVKNSVLGNPRMEEEHLRAMIRAQQGHFAALRQGQHEVRQGLGSFFTRTGTAGTQNLRETSERKQQEIDTSKLYGIIKQRKLDCKKKVTEESIKMVNAENLRCAKIYEDAVKEIQNLNFDPTTTWENLSDRVPHEWKFEGDQAHSHTPPGGTLPTVTHIPSHITPGTSTSSASSASSSSSDSQNIRPHIVQQPNAIGSATLGSKPGQQSHSHAGQQDDLRPMAYPPSERASASLIQSRSPSSSPYAAIAEGLRNKQQGNRGRASSIDKDNRGRASSTGNIKRSRWQTSRNHSSVTGKKKPS